MKPRFRITPDGQGSEPGDTELSRYRDAGKLLYNYERARDALHKRPLYKQPKAFLALLIILLITWLIADGGRRKPQHPPDPPAQQVR